MSAVFENRLWTELAEEHWEPLARAAGGQRPSQRDPALGPRSLSGL